MAAAGYSDGEIARHMARDPDVIGRKRRGMGIAATCTPALAIMMARINMRQRFRLQNQSRRLEVA